MMKALTRLIATLMHWSLILLLTGVGCGGPANIAPVSGVVTLDGKPVEGARINTQPIRQAESIEAGVGSFAVTDAEGRYSLELVTPSVPGAVVGEHVVKIKKQKTRYMEGREDAPVLERSQLPKAALDGSLRLVVPPDGSDAADFHLNSM